MREHVAPSARRRRLLTIVTLVLVLLVALGAATVVAFHNAAALSALRSIARGFGYDVAVRSLNVGLSRAVLKDVRIRNTAGEPVLDANTIDVAYSLRDLLPGSRRLFGLISVDISAPHITVIHHANGSYNVTIPQTTSSGARPNAAPLDVRLRVSDGTVDLVDQFVSAPRERRERLVDIRADGNISPRVGSYYHAGALLQEGTHQYPIRGNARFDDPRGFELQHWTVARLPIAALANFALSSHAIVVQGGEIRNLDVSLGALATAGGALQSHVGISGQLAGVRLASPALAKPIRDAHGPFVVDDDSATVRSLDATLNGIPLHVSGALYHFSAPQVAFALRFGGDLTRLRGLAKESAKLPLTGAIALQGLAEGPASNPLVFASLTSPHVHYGTYRLDGARGFVAISGRELDVITAAIQYGPARIAGRALVRLEQHTRTSGYAVLRAPASGLPYIDNIVPGMALHGVAAVSGVDAQLGGRGYIGGVNGSDRLDVPFALAPSGSGSLGPVVLQRRDGASLYARAVFDRKKNQTVALVDVHRLSLLPAPNAALPGLSVPALPPNLDAKLDATGAGIANGTSLASANGALHAYGSWGDVRAIAAAAGSDFGAQGRLTSSFEQLVPFTGDIGAHGGIDIPFAATNGRQSTIVQIRDAQFRAASVHGIALQSASATLGVAPPAVDIYAADLRVADHDVTAAGSFGAGGTVHLTAGELDLRAARAAGLPLAGGSATVIADIGGSAAHPTANVRAALAGARYANTDLNGDIGVNYESGVLEIDRASLAYGGAYANASGAVSGLTLGRLAPRYDIRARLEDADIATIARSVKNPLRYPAGTIDADLRVGGSGSAPSVTGDAQIPEGSLNGLYFRAARVGLVGNMAGLTAAGGRVTVGETTLRFGGSVSRARQHVTLRSDQLDLADFNDYFDEADVLAGTGKFALTLNAAPQALRASADVALENTRYRRFDLGNVNVGVNTAGSTIRTKVALAGANGQITVAGSVNVPATDPLRDIARRSYLDVQTRIAGVKLGNVLPAAGLSVPVVGVLNGSANVRGRYPALALSTQAALTGAVAGRIPIQKFTVAATAANGRGRLTDFTLLAPGLAANVTGSFGLRPADTFDLQAHVSSPDINELVTTASGKNPGIHGVLAVRAHVTGTLAQPRFVGAVDATNLTSSAVTIPAVHADLSATRSAVDVRNGSITLPRGTVAFDAHAPLGGALSTTPIALDFTPHRVDVSPYSLLLGEGSVVQGIFDGNVGLRGTIAAPKLNGNLAFTGGSYRSSLLTNPLTAIALDLDFSGTRVRIAQLHVHAGSGNIDGTGTVAVRDLHDPIRGLTADVKLTLANATIAAPKYYAGSIDGTITARKRVAAPAVVGGDLTFSSARIPYTALLPSGGASQGAAPSLPDVGLDLGVTIGRDVRVQSGPVDIGTTGMARLGGTLAKPTLNGQFGSTDGTVSLYRTFTVQSGSVVNFSASDGITPSVDATAVTSIADPPTDVLLRITGLSTNLHLAFSSQPAYSQQQILGLLVDAQALGAVSGVAASSGSPSNGVSIAGIGEGVLNTQLTQKFLQPLSSKLGGALGLSDLNVNYSLNGAVSATARRKLSKNVSLVYGEQIGGLQPRTSVGLNFGNEIAGAQLTYYQASGSQTLGQFLTPYGQNDLLATQPPNYTLQAIAPPNGTGFVFSYQRRYW